MRSIILCRKMDWWECWGKPLVCLRLRFPAKKGTQKALRLDQAIILGNKRVSHRRSPHKASFLQPNIHTLIFRTAFLQNYTIFIMYHSCRPRHLKWTMGPSLNDTDAS